MCILEHCYLLSNMPPNHANPHTKIYEICLC